MNRFILTFCLVFAFANIVAQKVTVNEQTQTFANKTCKALVTKVYFNDEKAVKKGFEAFFKDKKAKISEKKGIYNITNIIYPSVSSNPISAVAKLVDMKGNNQEFEVSISYNLGIDVLSQAKYPTQFDILKSDLNDLVTNLTEKAFNALVSEEEKTLDKAQKQLDSYNKNKGDLETNITNQNDKITEYNQKIVDYQAKITDCQAKITKDANELSNLELQITDQESSVAKQREKIEELKNNYGK